QRTFDVDNRAYRLFTTLFHIPFTHSVPNDVLWVDFLHAMVSVGFTAHKLQGSAWQFCAGKSDNDRPIQIHEPHPNNRIPFALVRRFGRRLARAYYLYSSRRGALQYEAPS
ncbi:hypothetical protein P280DRAFT_401342, partial [Massarina eburnea CBS 473.64]